MLYIVIKNGHVMHSREDVCVPCSVFLSVFFRDFKGFWTNLLRYFCTYSDFVYCISLNHYFSSVLDLIRSGFFQTCVQHCDLYTTHRAELNCYLPYVFFVKLFYLMGNEQLVWLPFKLKKQANLCPVFNALKKKIKVHGGLRQIAQYQIKSSTGRLWYTKKTH